MTSTDWSMPRSTLQIVAGGLALIAVASFIMGAVNAPARGRLPGERANGSGSAAAIQATDFTPLSDERIEGAPPPVELTPEEKVKLEADKKAKQEADAAKAAEAQVAAMSTTTTATTAAAKPAPTPTDRVGDLLDSVTPPADDPPH